MIILSGRLKHRFWSAAFLIAGLVIYSSLGGATVRWEAVLIVIAADLACEHLLLAFPQAGLLMTRSKIAAV